jgi:hypothetical protein
LHARPNIPICAPLAPAWIDVATIQHESIIYQACLRWSLQKRDWIYDCGLGVMISIMYMGRCSVRCCCQRGFMSAHCVKSSRLVGLCPSSGQSLHWLNGDHTSGPPSTRGRSRIIWTGTSAVARDARVHKMISLISGQAPPSALQVESIITKSFLSDDGSEIMSLKALHCRCSTTT